MTRSSSVSSPLITSSTSLPSAVAMSRTARGSGAVIVRDRQHPHLDRGVLQLAERAGRRDRARRRPTRRRPMRSSPITCSSRRPVQNGLGDEVEQTVDLLRRHANRAPVGSSGGQSARRPARPVRLGLAAAKAPARLAGELVEQIGRGARLSPATCLRSASAARSSGSTSCAGNSPASRACARTSSIAWARSRTVVEPEHRGAALDRVGVAKQRVDRVGVRDTALEREQRVDHAVEPLVRLVAKELEELRFGVWLGDAHAAATPS